MLYKHKFSNQISNQLLTLGYQYIHLKCKMNFSFILSFKSIFTSVTSSIIFIPFPYDFADGFKIYSLLFFYSFNKNISYGIIYVIGTKLKFLRPNFYCIEEIFLYIWSFLVNSIELGKWFTF